MLNNNIKKIILSGGGTGGSVTPLLAIAEIIKSKDGYANTEFFWLGTKTGPERELVQSSGIAFKAICSGKWRRYWSPANFADIFRIKIAFFQALYIIIRQKPALILSAGSFASVPVVWAAWLARVPVLIFQLDVRPGLANRLMAPFAKKVLTVFEKSLADYGAKALLLGNPVRKEFKQVKISKREAMQKIGLRQTSPVVLVIGGGTGASAINNLIIENLDELTKFCQILHITGKGKASFAMARAMEYNISYKYFEFLDAFGVIKTFAAADVIISRAGMGVLTELCFIGKPAILIPMPNSHQEENAAVFQKAQAALVMNQDEISGADLIKNIKLILSDEALRKRLKNNIKAVINTECEEKIFEAIRGII